MNVSSTEIGCSFLGIYGFFDYNMNKHKNVLGNNRSRKLEIDICEPCKIEKPIDLLNYK